MRKKTKKAVDFIFVGKSKKTFENDFSLLERAGYQNIQFSDSATEARNILTSTTVNFVISELEMQHMNGIEFLKLLRRHPFLMVTPFLLVSKDKHMEMIKYALDEMADGYLLSPYTGEEFLCAIMRVQLKHSSLSNLQIRLRNARHQLLKRQYDKSIELVTEIVKHDPKNTDALLILSECLYRKREIDAAQKHIRRILESQPQHSKALHLLSKICRFESDPGDAFNHLSNALRKNPFNVDLKVDLGKFYLESELEDKAKEVFAEVMDSNPTDLSLIKIGKALLKKNRIHEAGEYLGKTYKPLPETAYIFHLYSEMLEKSGNSEASMEQLKKCVSISPSNPKYTIEYADALKRTGKSIEANEVLRDYLKIDPEDETVKAMIQEL